MSTADLGDPPVILRRRPRSEAMLLIGGVIGLLRAPDLIAALGRGLALHQLVGAVRDGGSAVCQGQSCLARPAAREAEQQS